MSQQPLPRIDWDFTAVPPSQWTACCFWEYARESSSIRQLHLRSFETDFWEKSDSFRDPIHSGISALSFHRIRRPSCDVFRDSFFGKRIFPQPWQSLPSSERQRMANRQVYVGHPAFYRSDEHSAFQLVHRFDEKQKTWVHDLRASLISDYGLELTVVEIDWRAFTNEAILRSFRGWLKENRPKQLPKPIDQKGKKPIDWFKRLRDLGIMRLMHSYTLAEMPIRCPEADKQFETWESKHWSAARHRALANFRWLFPFLPRNEFPEHARTKGGRAKLR